MHRWKNKKMLSFYAVHLLSIEVQPLNKCHSSMSELCIPSVYSQYIPLDVLKFEPPFRCTS